MKNKILVLLVAICPMTGLAGNIEQTIQFNGVTAQRLFEAFTNAEEHEAALGKLSAPVSIKPIVGEKFSAFPKLGGGLSGKVIAVTSGKQIALSWRTYKFASSDADSILTFTFSDNEKGAQLEMVHANVPDLIRSEVNTHWNMFYWDNFRPYIQAHQKSP